MSTYNRFSLCGIVASQPRPFGKRGRVEFEIAGFAKDTTAKEKFFHLVVRVKAEKMAAYKQGDAVFIAGRMGDHRKGGVLLAKEIKPCTGTPTTDSKNGIAGLLNAHNKATLIGRLGQFEEDLSHGYCSGTIAVEEKNETTWHKIFFIRNKNTAVAFDKLKTGLAIVIEGPILSTPKGHNLRAEHLQLQHPLQSQNEPPRPSTPSPSNKANLTSPTSKTNNKREPSGCIAALFALLSPHNLAALLLSPALKK